mgnify:CR=1 FL=1
MNEIETTVETCIRPDGSVEVGHIDEDYDWHRLAVYASIQEATENLRYWQGWVDAFRSKPQPIDVFKNILDEDYVRTSEKQVAVNLVRAALAELDKIPRYSQEVDTRFRLLLQVTRLWMEIQQTFPK